MCDYSLGGIPNRLATEGEELVVHRFSTGAAGLACPADLEQRESLSEASGKKLWQRITGIFNSNFFHARVVPAVCIPPGALLIVKDIPLDLQKRYGIEGEEGVTFTQTSAVGDLPRDTFRFQNGRQVRIQELPRGLRVEVLSLAGAALELNDRDLMDTTSTTDPVGVPVRR
jgi:hypothetical protein